MFLLSVKECQLKLLVHYAPLVYDNGTLGLIGGGGVFVLLVFLCVCVYIYVYRVD